MVQAGDDGEDKGASSVEPTTLVPIRTDIPEKCGSFTATRVPAAPPSGRRG
jgi:hypothetical protein